jgi:hypothetical protein
MMPARIIRWCLVHYHALIVLVEGDDIGDGLFITLIMTNDELQFDTHTGVSPGSSDR